jgi:RHS repeat-associated protein
MDRAGGTGGLLGLCEISNNQLANCHFAAYDGNGNVNALVSALDFSTSACYEYSPYGEMLRSTGPSATINPFRMSTKFCDEKTGLVYYGYRYYSRSLGRWLGRDIAQEDGGLNLYNALLNSPPNQIDTDGRWPSSLSEWAYWGAMANFASTLHNLSAMPAAISAEAIALSISVAMDQAMSGALLKNIGGALNFAGLGAAGLALKAVPVVGAQS